VLKRLQPYWPLARRDLVIAALLLIVAAAAELLTPWPVKALVDYVFGDEPHPAWIDRLLPSFAARDFVGMTVAICLATVFLAVTHRALHFFSQFLFIRAGGRIVAALRCRICEHLHRLSLTYHDTTKVGDSIYRAAYDTTAPLALTSQALAPVISGVLLTIGVLIVMFRLDWVLTLVTIAVAPIFFFLIRVFGRKIETRSRQYHEAETSLVSTLQESLASIRAVQAFSREPQVNARIGQQTDRSLAALKRQVLVQLFFSTCIGLVMAAGTATVIAVGASRVNGGFLTVGDVLVFLAYVGMLYQPMNAFSQSASVVHAARTQIGRVMEVLDKKPAIAEKPDARAPATVRGEVRFRNVAFGYEPDRPVLREIDVTVMAGEVIALVGRTGAGKTTFASLLMRFYDPQTGTVTLDGHDLRDLPLAWFRGQVSVVLQDTILLSGTVAENIAYARPDATRAMIEEAARRAQADGFIRELPGGYDAMLGERGATLSGGQRQRIAVARALLKDAPVLILDEPTSALDSQTEHALIDATRSLMAGRTTFIIAHRMSTVRLADRILVFDQGRIVEQGTHDELMSIKSRYRAIYDEQRRDLLMGETAASIPAMALEGVVQ